MAFDEFYRAGHRSIGGTRQVFGDVDQPSMSRALNNCAINKSEKLGNCTTFHVIVHFHASFVLHNAQQKSRYPSPSRYPQS